MKKIKRKLDSKGTKDKIIDLFFIKHIRPTDITKEIGVAKSYVTKIIKQDSRYIEEKERRKSKSKERHKIIKKDYIQKKRQEEKQEYLAMQKQIDRDNAFLSSKKEMNDIKFVKWNRSVYEYAKNGSDLVLREGINAGYNAPQRVGDIVHPDATG